MHQRQLEPGAQQREPTAKGSQLVGLRHRLASRRGKRHGRKAHTASTEIAEGVQKGETAQFKRRITSRWRGSYTELGEYALEVQDPVLGWLLPGGPHPPHLQVTLMQRQFGATSEVDSVQVPPHSWKTAAIRDACDASGSCAHCPGAASGSCSRLGEAGARVL